MLPRPLEVITSPQFVPPAPSRSSTFFLSPGSVKNSPANFRTSVGWEEQQVIDIYSRCVSSSMSSSKNTSYLFTQRPLHEKTEYPGNLLMFPQVLLVLQLERNLGTITSSYVIVDVESMSNIF